MPPTPGLHAAGRTDPGRQRENNEDRFHEDPARGIFMVVDGVGGHAAGDKAAETAVTMLRRRLERETGAVEDRVREAITVANNEVHRLASLKDEWHGMGCVLTVAVVDNGDVVVGHVGDTRLYKIRDDRIEKITRDHSPVGEREDAGELAELDAMSHPRRNEVYRDVGSAEHQAFDPDFIDVTRVTFEPDAALLLCSDGLTDCITSAQIMDAVRRHAGRPHDVAASLIQAANDAGGKDNVTVVYVEGRQFVAGVDTGPLAVQPATSRGKSSPPQAPPPTGPSKKAIPAPRPHALPPVPAHAEGGLSRNAWILITLALVAALAAGAYYWRDLWLPAASTLRLPAPSRTIVKPGDSIAGAIAATADDGEILMEPGEYRERLVITKSIRLSSRNPRSTVLRLPAGSSESDAAITVSSGATAHITGFHIIGDAATPLGTGISVSNANLWLQDVEISGAAGAAIQFGVDSVSSVVAAALHDNPGAAIIMRAGSEARVAHSHFARNGTATGARGTVVIEPGAQPAFTANVFAGLRPDAVPGVKAADNFFPDAGQRPSGAPQRQGGPRRVPR